MELKPQSKWSWLVAAYLFLAGLGAGAYAVGVLADFAGGEAWAHMSKVGVLLGFPCVLAGCMFLIGDLGTPVNFWRAWKRPNTSWIARGTLIITIFMVLAFIHTVFWIWPFHQLESAAGARNLIGVLGIIFAFGTMIYTGILLGAARPIAFWSTAMLPLLFLVSALSTGMMSVILVESLTGGASHAEAIGKLAWIDMIFIILEFFVLAFYLQATHRVPESRASARLVLGGRIAPLFWLGVVAVGLLVPFLLEIAAIGGFHGLAPVAAACGIVGGLFLRQVVVSGGIHAPLRAGRFEFALPA